MACAREPRVPARFRARTARSRFGNLFTAALVSACGGSSAPPAASPDAPRFVTPADSARVSAASPFTPDCDHAATSGTLFVNAEVEPHLALNPTTAANWVGTWQQNRWSNSAAEGVLIGVTTDGGATWNRIAVPFSRCTGGSAANGGDYERATDPWVSFAPDGAAYAMALAVTGAAFAAGSGSAMRVARSRDGGRTWEAPVSLIADGAAAFNDKNSITADPTDPRFAYAVWDRALPAGNAPLYFARTTDGGTTWETARAIHDPGARRQTIGAIVAVTSGGTLATLFTRIDAGNARSLWVLRSEDKGATWQPPVKVADLHSIGAFVPETRQAIRDGGTLLAQIAAGPGTSLYVVWQDARFSSGQIDAIALARSSDTGLSWSAPVRVSAVATAQAFTPQISVARDGTIGVSYYDLRSDTPDAGTTPTEYWLARSRDGGATWTETRLAGPFDIQKAPNAGGLFLGDYQGLAARAGGFVSLFVQTTEAGSANRTDVFALPAPLLPAASQAARRYSAGAAPPFEPDAAQRAKMSRRVGEALLRRGRLPPQSQ